jgi:hypothetical protein
MPDNLTDWGNLGAGLASVLAIIWFLKHLVSVTLPEQARVFREELAVQRELFTQELAAERERCGAEHKQILASLERLCNDVDDIKGKVMRRADMPPIPSSRRDKDGKVI